MTDTNDNTHTTPDLAALPPADASLVRKVALGLLVVGAVVFAVAGAINMGMAVDSAAGVRDFFFAYQCGYVFWLSLPFGSLGLLMIGYLTSASWQTVLRRQFQAATRTLPLVAVLFVPVAVSAFVGAEKSPFWWADPAWQVDYKDKAAVATVAQEKGLPADAVQENAHKVHDFLNPVFFAVRGAIYLAILGAVIYFLNVWGRAHEETDDPAHKGKLVALSGPGLIMWALILIFAATDWAMSVEPTWASSMFPVVYGMNMFVTAFAVCIALFYTLNADKPQVMAVLKEKFRIDMASLMLALTLVWAYATFCQYMLMWAGNLPEELTYFRKRGEAGWQYLAYFLMIFHWVVPFFCITMRNLKTDPKAIRTICLILLAACAADVIWWLLPAVPRPNGGLHVPMAIGAILAVGGVWGLAFARELGKRPILPANADGRFLALWGHH